jgi:hypothetical protein
MVDVLEELTASTSRAMSNDGDIKLLRSVGKYIPDYTARHFRRLSSSEFEEVDKENAKELMDLHR